ncbi:hypothetical protein BLOT_004296 [Blomia tropicalis]|nr:hypothetical protein BLOT_004296 [Blomia tropicalis]
MPNYKTLETFPAKISLPNFAKKIFEEEEKEGNFFIKINYYSQFNTFTCLTLFSFLKLFPDEAEKLVWFEIDLISIRN